MIESWREELAAAGAPFYFVQLPEYLRNNDTELADFRECQLAALTAQPGASRKTAISPYSSIAALS